MILVGQRLCVIGDWDETPVPDDRLDVRLRPSFSFGTGAHPSTRAILEEMEALVTGGDTVLDVGTGSGVLAIAAVKLGAARVYAADIAPEAIETLRGNVVSNGMEQSIEIIQDRWPRPLGVAVDLMVMNIDDAVLIEEVLVQVELTPTAKVVVVPDADDRTVVEAAALAGGLSLLRTRPAGNFMRASAGPVTVHDAQGRTFLAQGLQQQGAWTTLVFEKVSR